MTSRKRSGSGSSKRPKEKVVYIYEIFFRGENPENSQQERPDFSEFWNEFFLLQPNVEALEMEVTKLTAEQFTVVKPNLNVIFQKCIEILDTGECVHGYFCCSLSGKCVGVVLLLADNCFSLCFCSTDHPKRLCNSLQTLCSLFFAIFKKSTADTSYDILNEIFGYEHMDKWMKQLMEHCNRILLGECG